MWCCYFKRTDLLSNLVFDQRKGRSTSHPAHATHTRLVRLDDDHFSSVCVEDSASTPQSDLIRVLSILSVPLSSSFLSCHSSDDDHGIPAVPLREGGCVHSSRE